MGDIANPTGSPGAELTPLLCMLKAVLEGTNNACITAETLEELCKLVS